MICVNNGRNWILASTLKLLRVGCWNFCGSIWPFRAESKSVNSTVGRLVSNMFHTPVRVLMSNVTSRRLSEGISISSCIQMFLNKRRRPQVCRNIILSNSHYLFADHVYSECLFSKSKSLSTSANQLMSMRICGYEHITSTQHTIHVAAFIRTQELQMNIVFVSVDGFDWHYHINSMFSIAFSCLQQWHSTCFAFTSHCCIICWTSYRYDNHVFFSLGQICLRNKLFLWWGHRGQLRTRITLRWSHS